MLTWGWEAAIGIQTGIRENTVYGSLTEKGFLSFPAKNRHSWEPGINGYILPTFNLSSMALRELGNGPNLNMEGDNDDGYSVLRVL